MQNPLTVKDLKNKLEHFCAYQERCHQEVIAKLRTFNAEPDEVDAVVVYLINENFLNEERFARSFARGKHRIKFWGKVRISNELKLRNISQYNIKAGLSEINSEDYFSTLNNLASQQWQGIQESNPLKKKKKFCDFLLRKGYESNLVYEALKNMIDER